MGFGEPVINASLQTFEIEGCEVPAYNVPVHSFVAEHPAVEQLLTDQHRVHSGELAAADLSDTEVALQFKMLAGNCSEIVLNADDETLRRQACDAVVETVVRLQNPQYATDQIEVRTEAHRISEEFETRQWVMRHFGQELTDRDPSIELLQDFDTYVNEHYDVDAMHTRAALTLVPMIAPQATQGFIEATGVVPELDVSMAKVIKRIGAFVGDRLVMLRVA